MRLKDIDIFRKAAAWVAVRPLLRFWVTAHFAVAAALAAFFSFGLLISLAANALSLGLTEKCAAGGAALTGWGIFFVLLLLAETAMAAIPLTIAFDGMLDRAEDF